MTTHLLAMELGPVVQIIAASRKTRDLYFGSWMLSEIAKAAAYSAATRCGNDGCEHTALIATAPASMEQLAEPQFAIGDEILVLVPAGVDPAEVAKEARQAAHDKWIAFATEARQAASVVRDDIWDEQTVKLLPDDVAGEVVELYAAWAPHTDDYQATLRHVK